MTPNIISPALLISAKHAANALSISERTLWGITAPRGPLPAVKIGTRVLYDPADLTKYIEGQKTKGAVP
jgi:hypothetical protein